MLRAARGERVVHGLGLVSGTECRRRDAPSFRDGLWPECERRPTPTRKPAALGQARRSAEEEPTAPSTWGAVVQQGGLRAGQDLYREQSVLRTLNKARMQTCRLRHLDSFRRPPRSGALWQQIGNPWLWEKQRLQQEQERFAAALERRGRASVISRRSRPSPRLPG